ncbi:signal peptide peptidase SppA [Candidatus Woesearchaeota archaeon]|nr:MAG: protease IV [archaeon GW2011_AR18]MBS3161137.1 signal peptide peptidase SppA [Candidatus Woesearchaeota archaeon]HIH26372.1 signal peptide peptidase SppA [Nanoarchaeota archaeon]
MNKWGIFAVVIIILYIVAGLGSKLFNVQDYEDKILVIPINGVITLEKSSGIYGLGGQSTETVLEDIKTAGKDKTVKGIILEINSPGGAVVASQEIADAVKSINKTKYAVIREVGASGGYWVASSTDKIIASPMSITGSIGVIGSYLEFSGLFEKYGIGYERIVSGEKKDIGTPYRDLTPEEKTLMENKLKIVHEYFIKQVAINRHMEIDDVRKIATGEFYLGSEAKELGLIDEFGNRETAIELMKKELNNTEIKVITREHQTSIFDLFSGVSYNMGRGIGSVLLEQEQKGLRIEV